MGESITIHYFRLMLVLGLISMMLLNKSGRCEDYVVGGEQGWNSDTNFGAWSKDYNFTVGDTLVFKYAKEQHNVYEVTERAYRTCDTRSGVIEKYESGNERVKLNEQKKYWFVCGRVGHCLGGMRFHIDVTSTNSTPNAPLLSSSSTPNFHFFLVLLFLSNFIHFLILIYFFYPLSFY